MFLVWNNHLATLSPSLFIFILFRFYIEAPMRDIFKPKVVFSAMAPNSVLKNV